MKNLLFSIFLIVAFSTSCHKEKGCTDVKAFNYNPKAVDDDGSCVAKVFGCTDPNSVSYNSLANVDDGSCKYTGTARATNNSANPYYIYIDGVYTYSLNGSSYHDFSITEGVHSIRVLQESGYILYATDETFSVNIKRGDIAIVNFP